MAARVEPFPVRRLDDGEEFGLPKLYRRAEDKLTDVASRDGRAVYTPGEKNFYFMGEDDHPMQIIDF